jgi:hypothetical protein
MTQTFQPFGLSLVEHKGGKPNYPVTQYPLAPGLAAGTGSSFGQGDVMCVSSTADQMGLRSYQVDAVNPPLANTLIAGVFDSVQYTASDGTVTQSRYWALSTPVFGGYNVVGSNGTDVLVTTNDLPYCVYKVQCNAPLPSNGAYFTNYQLSSNGGAYTPTNTPAQGWLGANSATNQSTQAVNVFGGAVGINNNFGSVKIIGLAPQSAAGGPNYWTDPYPIVYVVFNASVFNYPTPSAN